MKMVSRSVSYSVSRTQPEYIGGFRQHHFSFDDVVISLSTRRFDIRDFPAYLCPRKYV